MTLDEAFALERRAFTLTGLEQADAFEVVADAFEEAGYPGAATRRAWAQSIRERINNPRPPKKKKSPGDRTTVVVTMKEPKKTAAKPPSE